MWLTAPGTHTQPAHDVVIASNDHFVALPSLGSIVPGWLLIVPRRPMATLSLMNVDERNALKDIRRDLTKRLQIYQRPVYAFEHGGALESVVSCGVDQAHLHLVPLSFNLLDVIRDCDMKWHTVDSVDCLSEVVTLGKEYLFAEDENLSLISFPEVQSSQWFRKVIAKECGEVEWDYKKNPNVPQVMATAQDLKTVGMQKIAI